MLASWRVQEQVIGNKNKQNKRKCPKSIDGQLLCKTIDEPEPNFFMVSCLMFNGLSQMHHIDIEIEALRVSQEAQGFIIFNSVLPNKAP